MPGIGPGTETSSGIADLDEDSSFSLCIMTPDGEFGSSSAFTLESTKQVPFGILVELTVLD
jgi:hypothetical protein